MSGAATAATATHDLVEDDDRWRRVQAGLTKVQMAVGLRPKLDDEDLKKLQYGKPLVPIDREKPTQIKCFGDVKLVCIDFDIKRHEGSVVNVSLEYCKVNTAELKDLSPKEITEKGVNYICGSSRWDFSNKEEPMSAEAAAIICTRIRKALEPRCWDHSDRPVFTKSSTFHEHSEHKKCELRQNIMLILGNKEKTLEDMKVVEFNPDDHLHIIDVLDVRQLNSAYLLRSDCKIRTPWTGSQKSQVFYCDDLPTIEQIWEARKCPIALEGVTMYRRRAVANLQATLIMAVDDACNPGWLRSLEQVEGGKFTPKRELKTWQDVKDYLLEFDLHMKISLPSADKERFIQLAKTAILRFDAGEQQYAMCRAKYYNYTNLLPETFAAEASVQKQLQPPKNRTCPPSDAASSTKSPPSADFEVPTPTSCNKSDALLSSTTSASVQLSVQEKHQKLPSNTSGRTSLPETSGEGSNGPQPTPSSARDQKIKTVPPPACGAASVPATSNQAWALLPGNTPNVAAVGANALPKDSQLPGNLHRRVREYKQAGEEFDRLLIKWLEACSTKCLPAVKDQLGRLYEWEWTSAEYGVPRKIPKISCENLKQIAHLAALNNAPISASKQILENLEKTIAGRQELREWHDRLPTDDERYQYNRNHQVFVNTLVEVRSVYIKRET